VLPSNVGGAHWGGGAIDPERQIAVVPVNRLAAMVQLIPREGFDLQRTRRAEQRLGALVAVDLKTGAHKWNVPLGSMAGLLDPAMAATIPPDWGSPNLGGPIATAGGLVFIGAALDRSLHAYDIETGRELWKGALPASGKATPMSNQPASGDQFVAISAGGGGAWGAGDRVVTFRLPRR
jgi:quinoprotein glucose dehydrogenase